MAEPSRRFAQDDTWGMAANPGENGSAAASLTCFLLLFFLATADGGAFRVSEDIDPLWVRRRLSVVIVVPIPPLVGLGLRVAFGRVLPGFLAAQRSGVEIAPNAA